MRVKSFVVGLAEGVDQSMEVLDQSVAELGDVTIHSLVDTVYSAEVNRFGRSPDMVIVRVVVYTPEAK